jgi:hypothetical protein
MITGAQSESRTPRSFKPAGEWNRLSAILRGNSLKVSINGDAVGEVSDSTLDPRGVLVVQPGSEMDFANLFVRELK